MKCFDLTSGFISSHLNGCKLCSQPTCFRHIWHNQLQSWWKGSQTSQWGSVLRPGLSQVGHQILNDLGFPQILWRHFRPLSWTYQNQHGYVVDSGFPLKQRLHRTPVPSPSSRSLNTRSKNHQRTFANSKKSNRVSGSEDATTGWSEFA